MAYSTSNPPALISQRVGTSGGAVWYYKSNDDFATVGASGYFSNGADLGMKVGDVVYVFEEDTGTLTVAPVVNDNPVDLGSAA